MIGYDTVPWVGLPSYDYVTTNQQLVKAPSAQHNFQGQAKPRGGDFPLECNSTEYVWGQEVGAMVAVECWL